MKVKAIKDYYDLQLKKNISEGKFFEVSEERADILMNLGLVICTEPKTEEKPNRRRKKNV